MVLATIGLALSVLSIGLTIIKVIGKSSTGYMRKEMDTFYLGTKK